MHGETAVTISTSPADQATGTAPAGPTSGTNTNVLSAWADAPLDVLLDSVPDAIVSVDAQGTVLLANAHALRLFGYTADELVGRPIEVLVPEAHRAVHAEHRARYALDAVPRPMAGALELVGRRRDGTEFAAEISLNAIRTRSGTVYAAAVRDVTERNAARAERRRLHARATEAARERDQAQAHRLESLGLLAGGVAHDFNNLLAVIGNYASCVRRGLQTAPGPHAAELLADIDQIDRAAERGAELTRQLLSFARLQPPPTTHLAPARVVADLVPMLRHAVPEAVRIDVQTDPDGWSIAADAGEVERVLINLVVNARDAMPDGGTVEIRVANITVLPDAPGVPADAATPAGPPLDPGHHVRIDVQDHGTGMPADVVARAFDPFFTTKPRGEGTGLGLATVFGIVTNAGGQVHLDSQEGLGTTVSVWFPAVSDTVDRRHSPTTDEEHLDGSP